MLHGWMDNAGTFDTLIPLLPKELSYLSIDLPGKRKLHFSLLILDFMIFSVYSQIQVMDCPVVYLMECIIRQ